ncbi:MAG: type IX secretion system protein PorQ [Cyclobacteriaceae bacterium]|nr:type IX secretion system protein PorQ [Cyclobacteriaceae bacterium]
MLRFSLYIITLFIVVQSQAQIGGEKSYEFLNIPHTAILTGLGGVNTSSADKDVNLLFSNPALVGQSLDGEMGFNYLAYFSGIQLSSFAYAHHFKEKGTLSGGFQYLSLGEIDAYDPSGVLIGSVKSGEMNATLTFSHQINHFRMGGGIKWVSSNIAENRSNAVMFDIGGVFIHPEKDLKVGLVIKNAGFVVSEYSETSTTKLPFDVQLGVSYKPEHMPFRFTITGYNLTKKQVLNYQAGDNSSDPPNGFDKVLSRVVIGTEVVFSENVNLRIGYNHLVREHLRLEQTGGGAGISFGLMIKIKKIEFSYSHGGYHVGGGTNNFTIATNINRFVSGAKTNNND